MEYQINKSKLINEIIIHTIITLLEIGVLFYFIYSNDISSDTKSFTFIIVLGSLLISLGFILSITVLRNYYVHDKDVIVIVDNENKMLIYKKNQIQTEIPYSEIEAIFQVECRYIFFIPYFYELYLKNGDIIYISYLLIERMAKITGIKIPIDRQFNIYLPK